LHSEKLETVSMYETKKHVYFLFHSRIIKHKALWFYLLMCALKYQALDKQLGVWDTTGTTTLWAIAIAQLHFQISNICPVFTKTRSMTIR